MDISKSASYDKNIAETYNLIQEARLVNELADTTPKTILYRGNAIEIYNYFAAHPNFDTYNSTRYFKCLREKLPDKLTELSNCKSILKEQLEVNRKHCHNLLKEVEKGIAIRLNWNLSKIDKDSEMSTFSSGDEFEALVVQIRKCFDQLLIGHSLHNIGLYIHGVYQNNPRGLSEESQKDLKYILEEFFINRFDDRLLEFEELIKQSTILFFRYLIVNRKLIELLTGSSSSNEPVKGENFNQKKSYKETEFQKFMKKEVKNIIKEFGEEEWLYRRVINQNGKKEGTIHWRKMAEELKSRYKRKTGAKKVDLTDETITKKLKPVVDNKYIYDG